MKQLEAKDLRIGNLVYGVADNKKIVTEVTALDNVNLTEYPIWLAPKDGAGEDEYESVEPIPLTEEWLLKLGLEKTTHLFGLDIFLKDIRDSYVVAKIHKYKLFYREHPLLPLSPLKETKHAHELQNLYFTITGEELTLKQ